MIARFRSASLQCWTNSSSEAISWLTRAGVVFERFGDQLADDGIGILHPLRGDGVVVVLRLDNGDRQIRPVVKNVVADFPLASTDLFAPDNDLPGGEEDLVAHLRIEVPVPVRVPPRFRVSCGPFITTEPVTEQIRRIFL